MYRWKYRPDIERFSRVASKFKGLTVKENLKFFTTVCTAGSKQYKEKKNTVYHVVDVKSNNRKLTTTRFTVCTVGLTIITVN